ncbi:hypothetical protein FHS21_003291 [Phyllobacterium trifolii]|uniref:Uncharacterized protein n=1 Tax=Phyllobacterium trifolii TaxID=300193 RepID=A0A839UA99_9HYPH|nr:hypothetical protein [Phyllobacterium trifolii]
MGGERFRHPFVVVMSGSHLVARFRTTTAGIDAVLHIADAFAIIGTFGTDLGTFAACVLVVGCTEQHEMRRSAADLGAGEHQRKMLLLCVLASQFEAMTRRHRKASCVACQAFIDTGFHFGISVVHHEFLLHSTSLGLLVQPGGHVGDFLGLSVDDILGHVFAHLSLPFLSSALAMSIAY